MTSGTDRWVSGWQKKSDRRFLDATAFKIDGDYCKLIPLTKGMYAIVDAYEYERLSRICWHAVWGRTCEGFYAQNFALGAMHRYLLGLPKGDQRTGDHVDPSRTLDNRHRNLRIANHSQQQFNPRTRVDNTSGFKGVTRNHKGWMAQLNAYGRRIYLGTRKTREEARLLYIEGVLKYHKEYANDGTNWKE